MTEKKPLIKKIPLNQIETEAGTQIRFQINEETVLEYTEDLKRGDQFPPVILFYSGKKYYLADGFHRYLSHKKSKKRSIEAEVRKGNLRDAILYAVSANTRHGLKRTREDKQLAIRTLLKDRIWKKWSNREIARHCKVDHKTVGKIRKELTGEIPSERTYKTKHGTKAIMNTSKIGKKVTGEIPSENLKNLKFKASIKKKLNHFAIETGLNEFQIIEEALELLFKQKKVK